MAPSRRNVLALGVLSYLSRQPMHPYELGRTLQANGDARSIKYTHGSLYMVVQQLAERGLIEARERSRAGQRPERTTYAITEAGRAELHAWLGELVADPRHEYPQFVTALSLIGALHPDEVVALLRTRLERLRATHAEVRTLIDETVAGGVHPLFLVEEDYRLALLDAEIAFVERFIARITDPGTGWGPLWAQVHDSPEDSP